MRRLAAILAADVVGYSALMAEDEAGTLAALRTHRRDAFDPATERHGGRIVKLMGDGALVEFPSVVDAVECALAIQSATADHGGPIRLRIGINLGDVIIEGDDIYGDGVNVAARLEALAEPGGICISSVVHESIGNRVGAEFADAGAHEVKGIPRPIPVWRWPAVEAGGVEDVGEPVLALPEKPSIAILPFDNMSSDPEQDFFADGIAEDIITALSRLAEFFVTARTSSFSYKGRSVDVQQIGRELGIRYVVEGSVRRAGQRLRVTAQLIDATSGKHVWAERYDREVSDIFDIQDEITRSIVASTQSQIQLWEVSLLDNIERKSIPVWGLANRALVKVGEGSADSVREAVELAEQALEIDSRSGRAHTALAIALFHSVWMGFVDDEAVLARALAVAERAVRLNPGDEHAHWILGLALMRVGQFDRAIAELERAIEINPNCSVAYGSLGTVLNFAGEPERSIANNEIAIRSNPRDPSIFFRYSGLAISHYLLGDLETAVDWARKSIQRRPEWLQGHAALIASLVELGRIDEAQAALAAFAEQCANATITDLLSLPFRLDEHRARFAAALRLAEGG